MYSPITGKEGAGEGERGGKERGREERGGGREAGEMKDNPQYLNEYSSDYNNNTSCCCCCWLVTGFGSWFYPWCSDPLYLVCSPPVPQLAVAMASLPKGGRGGREGGREGREGEREGGREGGDIYTTIYTI